MSDQNGVWFGQRAKSPGSALSLREQTRGGFFQPSHTGGAHQHDTELEYFQVKWAAHLSYAAATALLSEVLPTADTISISGVQRRVSVVGAALEHSSSHAALSATATVTAGSQHEQEPAQFAVLAVDSARLKHCHPYAHEGRHVNLVAGRACFEGGKTRLYAYVHNQVASAATRLDQFLTAASGVEQNDRGTIFTDGAGKFEKAVNGALPANLPHPRLVPHRHEVPGH